MTVKHTYSKKEKLKSRRLMELLFKKGNSFSVFPLKLFYLQPETRMDFPLKTSMGVSSKKFPRAVDRNRIKRLMREVYRTEKAELLHVLTQSNRQVIVFLLYIDKTLPDHKTLKNKMPLILQKLLNGLNETDSSNT